MNCLLIFLLFWMSSIYVTVLSMSQDVINSILHQILDNDESYHQKWKKTEITPFTATAKSSIERVCDRMTGKNEEDRQRVVCCTPLETRVYRNVMIKKNTLHTYSLTSHEHSTPEVNNVKYQQVSSFTMKFFHHPSESFDPSRCTSFYNGTLHVFPKVTTHNVYHAVSDNVMPLVSQILLDSVLDQDFLYLPRKYLAYDHQAAPYKLGRNGGEALHLSLIEELMSDGSIRLDQTEGTCYRRIVWGPGPHIFFVDSLQALRRKSTQFLRLMTQHILQPYPYYTWPAINPSNSLNPLLKNPTTGEPLKVIVYTRGNTGRGRTMKNEELLVNQLKQYGANVFYCCNFDKVNITQQLYYAYEADVITGLHGAAIVHGLFMKPGAITIEWKTLYAYESILFGIIAESRGGIHAQIDIRKYFKPGGHHPMDHALVTRIMQAIHSGKQLQTQLFLETNNGDNMRQNDVSKVPCFPTPRIESVVNSSLPGDFIFAAHCTPHSIDHLLGPTRPVHAEMCGTTSFLHQIYKKVGKEAMNPIHCPICSRFSR